MEEDLISIENITKIQRLGYEGSPTYCKIFNWFREEWGYTSWIEKVNKEYNYKIYARGVYHRSIHKPHESSYCKTYQEAQVKLLEELITIVEEIEND